MPHLLHRNVEDLALPATDHFLLARGQGLFRSTPETQGRVEITAAQHVLELSYFHQIEDELVPSGDAEIRLAT